MFIAGETVTELVTQDGPTALDAQTDPERALAELIVTSLQLEVGAVEILPSAPLFGEGLGLDSIDALELALAISRAHGFELRSDDELNQRIFASLRSLSAHVEANRTR
jgi:acyl carrier protein